MLVDAGADVNAKLMHRSIDNNKDCIITPLWLAMNCGSIPIAQVLLQCGADTSYVYQNKTLWNWVIEVEDDSER